MNAPRLYYTPDTPDGLLIEDSAGEMYRIPEMTRFDGDRNTLMPIRSGGTPQFLGEMMIALVGVAEIAERAGVQPSTVHAWRDRHDDFPEPMAVLKAGPVWSWAAVERWLQVRPPTGRPARHDAVAVSIPVPTSRVLRHLRGDGVTTTFRLRDRFAPGSVQVEVDSKPTMVMEISDGRRFTVRPAPRRGADIRLEYRSILG
jgi:hypothetical protein